MPKGDVLWRRLEEATAAERRSVADALGLIATDVEALSAALRSESGSFLGNLFRSPHDLEYAEILKDCVVEAGAAAMFPDVWNFDKQTPFRNSERYIDAALAFAERRLGSELSGRDWHDAACNAIAALSDSSPAEVKLGNIQLINSHHSPDLPPKITFHSNKSGGGFSVQVATDVCWNVHAPHSSLKQPRISPRLKAIRVLARVGGTKPVTEPREARAQVDARVPLGRKPCRFCKSVSFDQVRQCPSCGNEDWW